MANYVSAPIAVNPQFTPEFYNTIAYQIMKAYPNDKLKSFTDDLMNRKMSPYTSLREPIEVTEQAIKEGRWTPNGTVGSSFIDNLFAQAVASRNAPPPVANPAISKLEQIIINGPGDVDRNSAFGGPNDYGYGLYEPLSGGSVFGGADGGGNGGKG